MNQKVFKEFLSGETSPWHSRWDLVVFLVACVISFTLFTQKMLFVGVLYSKPEVVGLSLLFVVNLACYVVMVVWVFLLLNRNDSVLLRVYVFLAGLIFTVLTRLIESGEEATQQGIDFQIVTHLFLAAFGHGGSIERDWNLFVKYVPLLLLVVGLFWKFRSQQGKNLKFSLPLLAVFLCALALSFVNPSNNYVPRAMASNGLVYLIKSAWFPVEDVRTDDTVFRFGPSANPQLRANHQAATPYAGIAKDMNVVVIALESTSANMLTFYPESDPVASVTPAMASLSNHALLVNEASAVMSSTSKSLVSIICGIEPYLKTEVFEVTIGLPIDCLPKRLSQNGYDTIFFQTATKFYEGRDRLTENTGFQEFYSLEDLPEQYKLDKESIGPLGLEDMVLLPFHEKWIEERAKKQKPFMAFYMTLAPHHPYLPKSPDGQVYAPDNRYLNDFTNSLAYIDEFINMLLNQYRKAGLYDNTLFVFVGDHGDAFGRYHTPWFHNNNMYREGIWVPFFIANEKLFSEKQFINGQYSLIDVAPTIEHLLGMEISQDYRGEQVFQQDESRLVYAGCWYKNRCLTVMDRKFKYIFNYGELPDELYHREGDFREQKNVIEQYPEEAAFYREKVFVWYNDVLTGYEHFFEQKHPGYRNDPEAFYKFPSELMPEKKEMERW